MLNQSMKPPEACPPLLPNTTKKTLVLDLDQTLVSSSLTPPPAYDFSFQVQSLHKIGTFYVLKRPGVDQFILLMANIFELVVFTASQKPYADPLLDMLDPECRISHRLYRDSCVQEADGVFVKDLSLLGRDLDKVIIVDDDERSYRRQPQNAIAVSSFKNDKKDHELLDLVPFLLTVAKNNNVIESVRLRKEEKWRKPRRAKCETTSKNNSVLRALTV